MPLQGNLLLVRETERGKLNDDCGRCDGGLDELVIRFIEQIRSPREMELSLVRLRNEIQDQISVLLHCQSGQLSYRRPS